MTAALYLLLSVAVLGAFDTFYYHEWRARLPGLGAQARTELLLHSARDLVYAVLFATLPTLAFEGRFVFIIALLLVAEIVLTLWDFVVEDWIRKPVGGVYPGERVMHAVIGILYGAMLAKLWPTLVAWHSRPAAVRYSPAGSHLLRWIFLSMAIGVLLSAVRDACAAMGVKGADWPWSVSR